MSLFLWVADMGESPTGTQPGITSVTTSTTVAGTCVGSTCTVSGAAGTTVVTTNPNDGNYTLNLYENGSLVTAGFTTSGGTYTKTFAGYSQSGGAPVINPALQYRVDIVLTTTGQVVTTKTGNAYTDTFGTCGGPA
jgi:hypothetical protein